jgi:hypothetical protein
MDSSLRRADVQTAADDLRRRTLSQMPGALERLIYLASTRDYNNGLYYHDGLASRFSEIVACQALADCHREVFHELFECSLEDLVRQLDFYVESTRTAPGDLIAAWRNLEPYRVAVPAATDPLASDFLCSNIKIALAVWESRLDARLPRKPDAWLPR